MIRGGSAEFSGQRGSGAGPKLLRVYPQFQSVMLRDPQHRARLINGKCVIVAESIAISSQARGGNCRNQLFCDAPDVFAATIGKLGRDGVSRQQRGNDTSRTLSMKVREHAQHAQFGFTIEAVAGLGFESGRASVGSPGTELEFAL